MLLFRQSEELGHGADAPGRAPEAPAKPATVNAFQILTAEQIAEEQKLYNEAVIAACGLDPRQFQQGYFWGQHSA